MPAARPSVRLASHFQKCCCPRARLFSTTRRGAQPDGSIDDLLKNLGRSFAQQPRSPPPPSSSPTQRILDSPLYQRSLEPRATQFQGRNGIKTAEQALREAAIIAQRERFEAQQHRKFRPGDVYAPHDLSAGENRRWRGFRPWHKTDVFDMLGLNPLDHYKNVAIMSEFMQPTGRIMPRKRSGLRRKNQRKIAKAIRRSVGMGLMPSVHRHPMIVFPQWRKF